MYEQEPGSADVDAGAAVALLSGAFDHEYELIGPLTGGETGATEIRHSDGTRFVLKWTVEGPVGRDRLLPGPNRSLVEH